ncbi:MAG: hypothetical protein ACYDD1_09065 [Caulobacteraceae bacterium]
MAVGTLSEWCQAHPSFRAALARADTQSLAWWEERARVALETGDNKFAAGAWAQVMRARWPSYRDKLEVRQTIDITSRLVMVDLRSPELATAAHQASTVDQAPALEGAQLLIIEG